MSRLMPRPTFANVCALSALVLAGGGLATAAVPDRSGTITACLKPGTGALRMLDTARRGAAGRCRRGERTLTWNQQGRPGADGRPGRDGVSGANGINGVNGVNGAANVVYRRTDTSFAAANTSVSTGLDCEAGERLLGGSAGWVRQIDGKYDSGGTVSAVGPADGSAITNASPLPDQEGALGYVFAGKNTTGANAKLVGYVICAKP
jgi:hypothetical protein